MEKERIETETETGEVMLPGFRFHPTDEELVGFYLRRKILHQPLSIELIKQLDIYKYDPWDLPKMATTGEKEWYFYCPRDRKYRNSSRPNRVTGAGFWKATGTDRPVYSSDGSKCIGLKKSLVFYRGRAAKGSKTDWMMHEFRLPSAFPNKHFDKNIPPNEAWAICRIFKKASTNAQRALSQSWISPLSFSDKTTNSDHTIIINPTTTPTTTTTSLPLTFDSSMAAATFSLLNYQQRPNSVYDASSLLLDMSTSVLGVDVRGLPEPCSGPSAAVEAAEILQRDEVDGEWGMIRFQNYSNLVWDYSSPCLSELSTAYSTSNCYT